jgi:hypothetical protein
LHIIFGCHSALTNLFSIYYSFHIIIIIICHYFVRCATVTAVRRAAVTAVRRAAVTAVRRAAVMAVRRHSCSTYYSHIIFGCHSTMTNLFSLIYYSLHIIIIRCYFFRCAAVTAM